MTFTNGDHGIDDNNVPCQTLVSNTVYGNTTAGINLEGTSPGGVVENNISVDNGNNNFGHTKEQIRVDATSILAGNCVDGTPASGPTVDYNLVNITISGVQMYQWGNTLYQTLSAFQTATGQEPHGIQADPKWVDPSLKAQAE